MCGIAGITGEVLDTGLLKSMRLSLAHRGPDDSGCVIIRAGGRGSTNGSDSTGPGTALIHTRLSILDLSSSGAQPMRTDDGRYVIVFNGEIYNYVELRQELEAKGYRFRSRSDTEVLLLGYACWGDEILPKLIGMFSFAIYDTQEHSLFLARDPFGIKPLYYVSSRTCFAFASELKTILTFSRRQAEPERIYLYLRYGMTDHGGNTFLSDVHQLPSGHYMCMDSRSLTVGEPVQYWQPKIRPTSGATFEEAAKHVRDLFVRSIQLHLRSDVPVGAALSGGIDSSSIVCAMRAVGGTNLDLHTFTFVAGEKGQDEEHWADIVSRFTDSIPHKVELVADDLVRDLDTLIYTQDEPFGSTNIYAQYRVFQLAREHGIKVVLDGQGGDEVLAGSRYYLGARAASLLVAGRLSETISLLRNLKRVPGIPPATVLMEAADSLLPELGRRTLRQCVRKGFAPRWINRSWFDRHGVELTLPRAERSTRALAAELAHSIGVSSLPHLLRWEDRNSMAFSIESRVPFLTVEFADFLLSLPESYLITPNGTQKAVFRAAMRGLVPDTILDRTDKIGFGAPECHWVTTRRKWVRETLRSLRDVDIPALDATAVHQEWEQIERDPRRYDWRIWRILNLIRWTQQLDISYI